jgi:hypothetical protein
MTTPITPPPTDTDALRTLGVLATPAPWLAKYRDGEYVVYAHEGDVATVQSKDDALLACAARNTWTALLTELDQLRAEVTTYKAEVGHADAEREEAERDRDAARADADKLRGELAEAHRTLRVVRTVCEADSHTQCATDVLRLIPPRLVATPTAAPQPDEPALCPECSHKTGIHSGTGASRPRCWVSGCRCELNGREAVAAAIANAARAVAGTGQQDTATCGYGECGTSVTLDWLCEKHQLEPHLLERHRDGGMAHSPTCWCQPPAAAVTPAADKATDYPRSQNCDDGFCMACTRDYCRHACHNAAVVAGGGADTTRDGA